MRDERLQLVDKFSGQVLDRLALMHVLTKGPEDFQPALGNTAVDVDQMISRPAQAMSLTT